MMVSCDDDDDPVTSTTETFYATLNGTSEDPPNSSAANGTATVTFNNTTKILTAATVFNGMVVTAAHIHKGAVGASGPPVFTFTDYTSPINFTSDPLNAAQEADLKANLYYINLHSIAYPDGEIRGQLIMQ
ncbi:MAG: CHRD domain-containing protein [Flavobacterium sp.]